MKGGIAEVCPIRNAYRYVTNKEANYRTSPSADVQDKQLPAMGSQYSLQY